MRQTTPHFPLLLAAAPLKRRARHVLQLHAAHFPLLLAAAPLKLDLIVELVNAVAGFSAAFSGGPIEA